MADVAIFLPDQTPQFLRSVNTPDYENNKYAIINPDLSNVENVSIKYWKKTNGNISEMSTSEKQAVDDVEKAIIDGQIENLSLVDVSHFAQALVNLRLISGTALTQELKDIKYGN